MRKTLFFCLGFLAVGWLFASEKEISSAGKITLVIHGGAGTIKREEMTPEKEKAYFVALNDSLQAGYAILKKGGSSLDAVIAAIRPMEDSPLFNAGKGSVFNSDGKIEMDASIMNGKDLRAGSVAAVTTIKNPILAARAVMEKSKHVMMIGGGAEEFAKETGLEIVDPSYFYTERRWQELQKEKEKEKKEQQTQPQSKDSHYGTVGAVALDIHGDLAAGTSTGGTNKHYGRVGDSPIIGAGTYANNNSCAVSATGKGEMFIRSVAAASICALVEYRGMSVQKAAEEVVMKRIQSMGGDGGVIVLDRNGNFAMVFNTSGMYRGYITEDGKSEVQIYR